MKLTDETESRLILQWMQTPEPRPVLQNRLAKQLLRARQAHVFMTEEPVRRKTVQQLMLMFGGDGKKYSETTAERDIQYAERLFRSVSQHTAKYMLGIELDALVEARIGAIHDRKWGEVARLGKVILEYLKQLEAEDLDKETLRRPVTRLLLFEPEALGVKRRPGLRERILEALDKKKMKDPVLKLLGTHDATDASFHEVPGGD